MRLDHDTDNSRIAADVTMNGQNNTQSHTHNIGEELELVEEDNSWEDSVPAPVVG